ncbi:MAG: hypothetical protein IKA51_03735 [Clostridia bacterium]|nr:hypothetical protein [Clostridia bacterium]
MKKTVAVVLALILIAVTASAVFTGCSNGKVGFKGSLTVALDSNGKYTSVKSGGKELITQSGAGGFFIYNFEDRSYYEMTEVSVSKKGSSYTVSGSNSELGATLNATLEQKNGAVIVKGTVKDTTGNDRRFRVEHSLPIDANGWRYGIDLNSSDEIKGKNVFANRHTVLTKIYQANYPFASISNDETGIAATNLFDSPVVYDYCYDNEAKLFTQSFYMGLSSQTKNPSEGSFSFALYDFKGYHGFRGAADGMYKIVPEAFETKAEEHGNWLFQQNAYYNLNGVEDYLGIFNESPNYIFDNKYGVASAKYVAPAEIWISWYDYDGPNAVPTAAELKSKLEKMLTMPESAKDMYDNVSQKDIASAIFSSGYYINKNNDYWNAGWNSSYSKIMAFIANGNPNIPAPSNYSIHRQIFNDEEAKAASEGYKVTGLYIDNANYGSLSNLDYNTANYKYSSYPLLWDNSGTLALPLGYCTWEFIDAFTAEESDKISLGNIAFPDNGSATALAHFFDIPGGEIGNSWGQTDEEFMLRRVNAYQKPWALLLTQNFNDVFEGVVDKNEANYKSKELLMKRSLFWGVMCNAMTLTADTAALESVRPLFIKYGTAQKLVSEAGWEPITHAVPTSNAISCERFGGNGNEAVWFTVRANRDGAENEGIYVPLPNLGFKKGDYNKLIAFDVVANKMLDVVVEGDIMTVKTELSETDDVAAVIIGTPAQIAAALKDENATAAKRIEEKLSELEKLADKKTSDPAEVIAEIKEMKKANAAFLKAVNKGDFAKAAAELETVTSLSQSFIDQKTFGAVEGKAIQTELTAVAERYMNRYKALSK